MELNLTEFEDISYNIEKNESVMFYDKYYRTTLARQNNFTIILETILEWLGNKKNKELIISDNFKLEFKILKHDTLISEISDFQICDFQLVIQIGDCRRAYFMYKDYSADKPLNFNTIDKLIKKNLKNSHLKFIDNYIHDLKDIKTTFLDDGLTYDNDHYLGNKKTFIGYDIYGDCPTGYRKKLCIMNTGLVDTHIYVEHLITRIKEQYYRQKYLMREIIILYNSIRKVKHKTLKLQKSAEECVVCYEDTKHYLNCCKNMLCKNCFLKVNKCPMCRSEFSDKRIE